MSSASDECQIRDVKLRGGQLGPVIVKFEHARLKKAEASDLKCEVYTSTNSESAGTVAAVAKNGGDVVYQGDVAKEGDLCRTFLAIRNKRTNKMRIYEASSVMMSPTVASNFVDLFDQQDPKTANYKLSHAFGSKKNKRIAEQKARMTVNIDNVKEKLSATAHDVTINEDTLAPVEDDSFLNMLPPCNQEAATPADVYPISGILSKKEIKSLVQYLSEAEESDQHLDPSRLSPFYQSLVQKTSQCTQKAALLLYAESLIRLCKMKKIVRNEKICLYSDLVNNKILKDFRTGQAFSEIVTQFMLDKALVHIIIIGLHLNGFTLDLEKLARSIPRLNMTRVRTLANMVGTHSMKKGVASSNLIELRVPLPNLSQRIPQQRTPRRK
ncbi:DNA-directed RNA polymerase I subunit RPA49-like [Thrips palmi]|uniref:DNA-directed RNA polymerase I subunit RPA49-like n=1 Tax=Thrips palmi TaxID=161013 RepID=A0A6P9A3K9_THRPL|nr:DNA-directed RNA polymerase I subunit RPA49-like [Thrips palmi]